MNEMDQGGVGGEKKKTSSRNHVWDKNQKACHNPLGGPQ